VRGIPLIAYQLALLAHHGVREVVVNTHHLAEHLETAARRHCPPGVSLTFSRERELLDTGGGIRRVAAFLRESDPCLLIGGDMLLDVDLGALVRHHREHGAAVTLLLREDARSASFGSIGVDRAGVVCRIGSRFDFGAPRRGARRRVCVGQRRGGACVRLAARAGSVQSLERLVGAAPRTRRARRPRRVPCLYLGTVGTLAEYLAVNRQPTRLSYLDADATQGGRRALRGRQCDRRWREPRRGR
jgi:hypothetical protein